MTDVAIGTPAMSGRWARVFFISLMNNNYWLAFLQKGRGAGPWWITPARSRPMTGPIRCERPDAPSTFWKPISGRTLACRGVGVARTSDLNGSVRCGRTAPRRLFDRHHVRQHHVGGCEGGTEVHCHAVRPGFRSAPAVAPSTRRATPPRTHRQPSVATTGACALNNEQAMIERQLSVTNTSRCTSGHALGDDRGPRRPSSGGTTDNGVTSETQAAPEARLSGICRPRSPDPIWAFVWTRSPRTTPR